MFVPKLMCDMFFMRWASDCAAAFFCSSVGGTRSEYSRDSRSSAMFWSSCSRSRCGADRMSGSRVTLSMSKWALAMVSGRMRMMANATSLIACIAT